MRTITFMLLAASCSGWASTVSSISATAGTDSCNQSGTTGLNCSVASGTANASALTIATFDSAGGRLEATSNGEGLSTSATASITYSNLLIVTGASGSGDLMIQFTGFQDILGSFPNAGTVSPLSVTVGGNSTTTTFPFNPGAFSVVLPVTFGSFEPFTLSFSDTATGTVFQGGILGQGNGDAVLFSFPTFVVTNLAGAPIPGANVEFVPEPAGFGLLLCAVPGLWLMSRRTRRAQAE